MKKLWSLLLAIGMLATLVACNNSNGDDATSEPAPQADAYSHFEWVDETAVENYTKGLVDEVNAGKYGAVTDKLDLEALGVSAAQLEAQLDTFLAEMGEFKEYGTATCVSAEEDGTEYVTIAQEMDYENGRVVCIATYDADMNVYNFWLSPLDENLMAT